MKPFVRDDDEFIAELTAFEVDLLFSLLGQLDEIVGVDVTTDDDPLVVMQRESESEMLDRSDPLVGRLFPNAYLDDEQANDDFARFTEYEQRQAMAKDSAIVAGGLANTEDGERPLRVYLDEIPAWVRTLTVLRLALATRLEIVDEQSLDRFAQLPTEDPDSMGYEIFEWLAFALESLLQAR